MLVCHGMGQQVPFETLQSVAGIFRGVEDRRHPGEPTPFSVSRVKLGETGLARAEIHLAGAGEPKSRLQVHVCEACWAPLTAGKIGLRETLAFLHGAGWAGLWNSGWSGRFEQWRFGKWHDCRLGPRMTLGFFAALAVIWDQRGASSAPERATKLPQASRPAARGPRGARAIGRDYRMRTTLRTASKPSQRARTK